MPAGTKQLGPSIQACPLWLKNNVVLLLNTQVALSSHRVKGLASIYDTP